jgi:DNA-directed RNA polymerase specialized sigma subunit
MTRQEGNSSAREQARTWQERADAEVAERLTAVDAEVAAARAELEAKIAARTEAIARAMDDEGWTLARIAKVLGLTPQRVSQLRKGQ